MVQFVSNDMVLLQISIVSVQPEIIEFIAEQLSIHLGLQIHIYWIED